MMIKNKKGVEDILRAVIYTVLALIVVIVLIVFGIQIYNAFHTPQGSMVSFEKLTDGIQILIDNPNASYCYEHFSIGSNELLAGFDKGSDRITRDAWIYDRVYRDTKKCPMQESCLTLCDVGQVMNEDDCREKALEDFKSFPQVQRFEYVKDPRDYVFGQAKDYGPLLYFGATVESFMLVQSGEANKSIITIIPIYPGADFGLNNTKPCGSLKQEKRFQEYRTIK